MRNFDAAEIAVGKIKQFALGNKDQDMRMSTRETIKPSKFILLSFQP
jgi:hypothetical protein